MVVCLLDLPIFPSHPWHSSCEQSFFFKRGIIGARRGFQTCDTEEGTADRTAVIGHGRSCWWKPESAAAFSSGSGEGESALGSGAGVAKCRVAAASCSITFLLMELLSFALAFAALQNRAVLCRDAGAAELGLARLLRRIDRQYARFATPKAPCDHDEGEAWLLGQQSWRLQE